MARAQVRGYEENVLVVAVAMRAHAQRLPLRGNCKQDAANWKAHFERNFRLALASGIRRM